ncbi:MAG: OmpA family protein [Bacteroidetes bacterium]|nr:OmpA family protein [Bacteroidota bacterium]
MKSLLIYGGIIYLTIFPLYSQTQDIEILKHKQNIQIEELRILNSTFRETNLSISPDGKYLFFMTDRGGMPWSNTGYGYYKGKPRYDGDIWYSEKKNGQWQAPKALGRNVNTSSGEDEPNVSPDGQFVIYQSWAGDWGSRGGPYFEAKLSNNEWSKPLPLGSGINQFFVRQGNRFGGGLATDGVAVSPDRNTFIVAFGPDYDGNMDLFMSIQKDGEWSYLKKLDISTSKDERSAFLAGDGKTLFFASNGYKGLGGLDIYQTTLNPDGSHSPIVNLGAPFNTPKDDYGFIITASGEEAYFVRDGDIFYANLKDNQLSFKPTPTMIISGQLNHRVRVVQDVILHLKEFESDKIISKSKVSYSGTYSFAIPEREGRLRIQSTSESAFQIDTAFYIKPSGNYQEIELPPLTYTIIKPGEEKGKGEISRGEELKLTPSLTYIKEAKPVDVDIHFDFDQIILAPVFRWQLDKLYESIKNKEGYIIKIVGHTDDKGGNSYNHNLGLRRAKVVSQYLQVLGIPKDKIRIETQGELNPIADNDSEEGAYQNRRVRVEIIYE